MNYSVESVGARLRSLRAARHVSQQEVSDATGIAVSSIKIYENDRGGMGLETAWKFADYYGIGIDQVVGRDFIAQAV